MWVSPIIRAHSNAPAIPVAQAPLPIYTLCAFVGSWSMEIGFTTMSLAYGTEILLTFI